MIDIPSFLFSNPILIMMLVIIGYLALRIMISIGSAIHEDRNDGKYEDYSEKERLLKKAKDPKYQLTNKEYFSLKEFRKIRVQHKKHFKKHSKTLTVEKEKSNLKAVVALVMIFLIVGIIYFQFPDILNTPLNPDILFPIPSVDPVEMDTEIEESEPINIPQIHERLENFYASCDIVYYKTLSGKIDKMTVTAECRDATMSDYEINKMQEKFNYLYKDQLE